ncbi:MAG: replication initiator protein [Microviridae sp.]|nr:MAG: replication initiator protein [Microviridae sp.]
MCLYPRIIINRKYISNKKNGGIIPKCEDPRTKYVPVGCGKCMECKKQRANNWRIRLMEEIRTDKKGKFVTMTISEEWMQELDNKIQERNREQHEKSGTKEKYIEVTGYKLDNEIATYAVRHFLERYRKEYGKSIKHWLVTELGQEKTERLHIHGIIWTQIHEKEENNKLIRWEDTRAEIEKIWKYGTVNKRDTTWQGQYVNEITVNYIVKYINKTDEIHKEYNPITLTSAGIGKDYLNRYDSTKNRYKGEDTKETYITRQGVKIGLPIYYRNKIYTEEEKEKLWIQKLNKEERWVNGMRVDISKDEDDYQRVLKRAREVNSILGYKGDKTKEEDKRYEIQRRNIQRWTRIKKLEGIKAKNKISDVDNNINITNDTITMPINKDFDNRI